MLTLPGPPRSSFPPWPPPHSSLRAASWGRGELQKLLSKAGLFFLACSPKCTSLLCFNSWQLPCPSVVCSSRTSYLQDSCSVPHFTALLCFGSQASKAPRLFLLCMDGQVSLTLVLPRFQGSFTLMGKAEQMQEWRDPCSQGSHSGIPAPQIPPRGICRGQERPCQSIEQHRERWMPVR